MVSNLFYTDKLCSPDSVYMVIDWASPTKEKGKSNRYDYAG